MLIIVFKERVKKYNEVKKLKIEDNKLGQQRQQTEEAKVSS